MQILGDVFKGNIMTGGSWMKMTTAWMSHLLPYHLKFKIPYKKATGKATSFLSENKPVETKRIEAGGNSLSGSLSW